MTEQEVLKEFEKLEYRLFSKSENVIHLIDEKKSKRYEKFYLANYCLTAELTMKEHQLLHKLFEIWDWFDE